MGLIKAGLSALNGTLADQWKEFFYCDALGGDTLVIKGRKRVSGRSSNTKGSENIITSGSVIAVADGQCVIIVDQGKVAEICAEPGEFVYDSSTEPSIFSGALGDSIAETFKEIGKRFTFGGDPAKDQRVYYINVKEIMDNKFGTANPVPFRVVDSRIMLDVDVSIRCNGVYSYKISDPIRFYTNVCANVRDEFRRSDIDSQLKTEFISALQPALGKLSDMELRPNQIVSHNTELEAAMNEALSSKWGERGIRIESVALGSVTLPDEDAELVKNAQKAAMYRDPTLAAANLMSAQADAMQTAAGNAGGAAVGFMGMNMAMNAAGNAQSLYEMGKKQEAAQTSAADAWTCACGNVNSGNFCSECGTKKPDGWRCACGSINSGNFCPECGAKRPDRSSACRCSKCGWTPSDPADTPKFCPECGNAF